VARHQSEGFCSAQPVCGEAKGKCSLVADATRREVKPEPAKIRAVSNEAAIEPVVQTHAVV